MWVESQQGLGWIVNLNVTLAAFNSFNLRFYLFPYKREENICKVRCGVFCGDTGTRKKYIFIAEVIQPVSFDHDLDKKKPPKDTWWRRVDLSFSAIDVVHKLIT